MPKIRVGVVHAAKRLAKKPAPPKVVRKTIGGVIHTEMIKPKPFGTPTGKRGRRT